MDIKQYNIPATPGCYQYFDKNKKIIYIGKAVNLKARVLSYWRDSANHTPAKLKMLSQIEDVKWIETDSEIEALLLEANLVKKHQPKYNIDLRDDKRFAYIKISTEDEIPGVFITRKIDHSGKYFGPFTSGLALKEVLKIIRRIWPYCTERKVQKKVCFHAQIGKCTGVCGGGFDLARYRKEVIEPIVSFLSGKKKDIIKNYELRIKNLEKELEIGNWKLEIGDEKGREVLENEIRRLKYQLVNIHNVLEHANVIGVTEKYAADVVELAKILGLQKIPERIEGFDISNIFGKEAVGSMVVFSGGEPDKNEYRKFKIKLNINTGDTGMLKEVMERRLFHSIPNSKFQIPNKIQNSKSKQIGNSVNWPLPDLIIIDGGKGQLNAVLAVMRKLKIKIPALAVSKGQGLRSAQAPDKIFFPGVGKPLELPLSSPALHIIKRVRDEAHRFAIKYHRDLRKKSWQASVDRKKIV